MSLPYHAMYYTKLYTLISLFYLIDTRKAAVVIATMCADYIGAHDFGINVR
jgi:hypothetical protein